MTWILRLTPQHWAGIVQYLEQESPHEACGLLAGQDNIVRQVYLIENELHSPWEYRMQPQAQVRAMLAMERAGWELVGIFHSHPHGPPRPSPTDIAQAYYPEAVYLICTPDEKGGWQGRGFRIEEQQVQEVSIVIAPN